MIETERLYLRKIETSDDIAMFELDSNPEVCTFLGNKPIKDLEEAKSMIQMIQKQYLENGIGRWAVIEKSSKNFIGWSGLKLVKEPINNQVDFYDLGYRFMPTYWNKGYATEAAKAWIDFGFNDLKLNKLNAMTDVNNSASKNVLEKLDFKVLETFLSDDQEHFWFELGKRQ